MDLYADFEKKLLYPYINVRSCEEKRSFEKTDRIAALLELTSSGNYLEALKSEFCSEVLPINLPSDFNGNLSEILKSHFESYLKNKQNSEYVLFCIGISCLQLFTQNNFCGPLIGPEAHTLLYSFDNIQNLQEKSRTELLLDTEGIYSLVFGPEYLLFARIIFEELKNDLTECKSLHWWCCRYNYIHQKVTDESSPIIFEAICSSAKEAEKYLETVNDKEIISLFNLEMSQMRLFYHDIKSARKYLQSAKEDLKININLAGALGKRTKWQKNDIPQLFVKVEYDANPVTSSNTEKVAFLHTDLPKDIMLTDDTRLNRIKYKEVDEDVTPSLNPIEQVFLLGEFFVKTKSGAQDSNLIEEKKAYISSLLQNSINWSVQLNSLLTRSLIEVSEPRATERSLLQVEELVSAINREEPSRFERLKFIYATDLITQWNLNQELARIYMRMGSIKTALDIFERLHLWDDVITCYSELQLRHKAAEIIRDLLKKEETPKLLCLLGEATDDIDCYFKAWEKSNYKSAKAQRCLGNHYYMNRDYKKAIEHYEISVKINSIQFQVWQRLAYSALQAEEWKKCAQAYHRCCELEPDSFECWNNISQAYLKMGQKERACNSLKEAVRCSDSRSWRLLENYLLVSTSLSYVGEALHTYTKILQIKENYVDTEILGRLVNMVINEWNSDNTMTIKRFEICQELIGKLTQDTGNAELWFLRANLVHHKKDNNWGQNSFIYYKKAVAASTQKPDWARDPDNAILVIMRSLRLLEVFSDVSSCSEEKHVLSTYMPSMRILIRTVVSHCKKYHTDCITNEIVPRVRQPLNQLEEQLGTLNNLFEEFKT